MTLRNPSDQPQEFSISPEAAFELSDEVTESMTLEALYSRGRRLPAGALKACQPITVLLQPSETVVMEGRKGAKIVAVL